MVADWNFYMQSPIKHTIYICKELNHISSLWFFYVNYQDFQAADALSMKYVKTDTL